MTELFTWITLIIDLIAVIVTATVLITETRKIAAIVAKVATIRRQLAP